MTAPPDPAAGPPSGRAAQATPGGPATHLPPRVAGGRHPRSNAVNGRLRGSLPPGPARRFR